MDLIWSGVPITQPNEQGCQGDRAIGIMDWGEALKLVWESSTCYSAKFHKATSGKK